MERSPDLLSLSTNQWDITGIVHLQLVQNVLQSARIVRRLPVRHRVPQWSNQRHVCWSPRRQIRKKEGGAMLLLALRRVEPLHSVQPTLVVDRR